MIPRFTFPLVTLFAASTAFAGSSSAGGKDPVPTTPVEITPPVVGSVFDGAIRPISNPTLFDLPVPRTQLHGIYMHQTHPDQLAVAGGSIPVGGDFNLFALQAEYAVNDRLAIIATKDGYIDFNPDGGVLSEYEGIANVAAGLKYAFIHRPEAAYALAGTATVEIPVGESDVWQGEGDGALNLGLSELKLWDDWQFASALGAHIPFDNDAESTTAFLSGHLSYDLHDLFRPLLEVNWYRVLEEGDGGSRFAGQAGGAVPSLAAFEGGDLINFGASNAGMNEDIVTAAIGFRSEVAENISLGLAYEIPLTEEEANLMEERFTVDFVLRF